MCRCQQQGKPGVPYPSGKCIVCGERVDRQGIVYAPAERSAQPCGCDPAAGWTCEQHRQTHV